MRRRLLAAGGLLAANNGQADTIVLGAGTYWLTYTAASGLDVSGCYAPTITGLGDRAVHIGSGGATIVISG